MPSRCAVRRSAPICCCRFAPAVLRSSSILTSLLKWIRRGRQTWSSKRPSLLKNTSLFSCPSLLQQLLIIPSSIIPIVSWFIMARGSYTIFDLMFWKKPLSLTSSNEPSSPCSPPSTLSNSFVSLTISNMNRFRPFCPSSSYCFTVVR